jgi:DNA-binding CsgD family transcriptional regulator
MKPWDDSARRGLEQRLRAVFGDASCFWGCKDKNSIFLCANEEYGCIIGLKHHRDVEGRTDFDMPCQTVAFADAFREQDKEVMSNRKTLRILDIHPFAGGQWRAYLTTKWPLYDDEEHVAGAFFHGQDITSASTVELGSWLGRLYTGDMRPDGLGQGSYRVGDASNMPVTLSERESEVLFFLIRGQSANRIAHIFEMSVRTVEDHVCALRHKFGCPNKSSLVEKAIYLGYLHHIPKVLLNRQLSMILRDA